MEQKQEALIELITSLPLKTQIKQIHDLFNGVTIFEFFYQMISQQDRLLFNIEQIYYNDEDKSYEQTKIKNFKYLLDEISKYVETKGLNLKQNHINIKNIVKLQDQIELYKLIKYVFQILMNSENAQIFIGRITNLSPSTQQKLKQIIQDILNLNDQQTTDNYFLNKIQQLQQNLQQKQIQRQQIQEQLNNLHQENCNLKEEIQIYKKDLQDMKKKNQQFEQLQHTFSSKQNQVTELNILVKQLKSSMNKQKISFKQKASNYQKKISQLNQKLAKYENENQISKLKKEIEEKDKKLKQYENRFQKQKITSKAINQRCRNLEERTKSFQNQKMDFQLKIQEMEMDTRKLQSKIKQLQQKLKDQTEQKQQIAKSLRQSKAEFLSYDINYRFKTNSQVSIDQCTNSQCQKTKQDLKETKKKCIQFAKYNEQLRNQAQNIDYSKLNLTDEAQKRIDQYASKLYMVSNENVDLKDKLRNLTNNGALYYEQQLLKQKRKISMLKKRTEQIQQTKNREIEIMISTLHELQTIIQQNLSNGKIVQIFRKLK